jgi:hydroxyethylthiazole kinase-like uncharacterized protein yjeF
VPEPFAVVSVAEMRALEAAAIEAGTPERVLQERAGLAVADVVEDELGRAGSGARRPAHVMVLVGAGNNGRDAVVAGRRLAARGCRVQLWHGSRCPLSEQELRDIRTEGVGVFRFDGDFLQAAGAALNAAIEGADVVVDGLLGVASRGPMREELASVAASVNAVCAVPGGPRVVAVDVPSGIGADDGATPGQVVRAGVTVTFGAVKAGLLRFPAASFVGRLVPRSIGLPTGSAASLPVHVLDEPVVAPLVPPRPLDAHKYRLGRVLVVAGSDRFVGAACLGSEAAARAGAGLIGVASTEAVKRVLATRLPEATYPLTLTDLDHHPEEVADRAAELLPDQAALLLGPGVDRSDSVDRFVRRLLTANAGQDRSTPTVIDADALSLLAGWSGWWEQIGVGNILTPHAGEMARLLTSDPDLAVVEGEPPWDTARRAAARWHQVIVLKGPFTAVTEPTGRAWVYPHANPALATAGTGDVLAGLCAGLLAQGITPLDAARLAVVVHALAGRRVLDHRDRQTLIASDLPAELPIVLAALARLDRRH